MDRSQRNNKLISTLKQKHIDLSINNILSLWYLLSIHEVPFPKELIFYIINIVWNMRSKPHLETSFDTGIPYRENSTLMIGDIIHSLARLGRVKVLKSDHGYRLFIKFRKLIDFGDSLSDLFLCFDRVDICNTPFILNVVNNKCTVGSRSMLVSIHVGYTTNINRYVYKLITKERPELSKYYLRSASRRVSYQFNDKIYKGESAKEAKRQIMIVWLRKISKKILRKGVHLGNSYHDTRKSPSIQSILSDNRFRIFH